MFENKIKATAIIGALVLEYRKLINTESANGNCNRSYTSIIINF